MYVILQYIPSTVDDSYRIGINIAEQKQVIKPKLLPIDAASILDTSGHPVDEEVSTRHFPNIKDERLVSDLHFCCIQVLYECRQSIAAKSSSFKDLDCDLLDEQLGRLFLWGQGFEAEELEDALDQSNELREMVLGSLCEVGKLIIHGR